MKYTFEVVDDILNKSGCKLLEYSSYDQPLTYQCECGEVAQTKLYCFQRGSRCVKCTKIKRVQNRRKTLELQGKQQVLNTKTVAQQFEKVSCQLLDDYKNAIIKMKYQCRCGRVSEISWNKFQMGHRCGYCKGRRCKKYTLEEAQEIFKEHGCELLAEEYQSIDTKMPYICKCGREAVCRLNDIKQGQHCYWCGLEKNKKDKHHAWLEDRTERLQRDLVRRKCYAALSRTLKAMRAGKNMKASKLLGYTVQELRQHLYNHPNWNEVKGQDWHLDHIFPISAFVEHRITDVKLINCLENLQPMIGQHNISKHAKYDKQAFKAWLESKGVHLENFTM